MGRRSSLVDVAEAADILGISVRTVYYKVHNGELKAKGKLGQRVQLLRDEVNALAEAEQSSGGPSREHLHKQLLAERAHRRALERRLEAIERVLGMDAPTLSYDQADILELLDRAVEAAKEPPTNPLEVHEWSSVFFGVNEEFFDLVERYSGNPEPWSVLLTLAEKMYNNRPGSLSDQDSVFAYKELEASRRNLRNAVFLYIQRRRRLDGRTLAQKVIPESETNPIFRLNRHVIPS